MNPDFEAVRVEVERFAKRLSRKFPQAFTNGLALSAKGEVIRWLRAALPPHPGRPRKRGVTLACKLRRKGMPWIQIYSQCIPALAALRWTERRKEIRRLHSAYRCRLLRSQRTKNPATFSHAEKN